MEDTNQSTRKESGEPKSRIPRSASFWISLFTFLLLFGLLFTGAVIGIVRLIRMLIT